MNPLELSLGAADVRAIGFCDVDVLNSLLRGEMAAVETYELALGKFADSPAVAELEHTRDEHQKAVETLRDRVRYYGGEPSDGSGPWGTFAAAVTGAAKVLGPVTVLAALKQGEQHGIGQYQAALDNPDVSDECQYTIRTELMPRCLRHVSTLETLVAGLEGK